MRTLAICVVVSAAICAQPYLSANISPNPAPANALITLTLQATENCQSLSACGLNTVIQGNPNGPLVFLCSAPLISAPVFGPNNARSWTWNSQGTPPGVYYMGVTWRDTATLTIRPPAFFQFRIDAPATTEPVISSGGPPTRGALMPLTITSPLHPGAYYIMAASFTSNVGFALGGGAHIAVDCERRSKSAAVAARKVRHPGQAYTAGSGQ